MKRTNLLLLTSAAVAVVGSVIALRYCYAVSLSDILHDILVNVLCGCVFAIPSFAVGHFSDQARQRRCRMQFKEQVQLLLQEILKADKEAFTAADAQNIQTRLSTLTMAFSVNISAYISIPRNQNDEILRRCSLLCNDLGNFSPQKTQEEGSPTLESLKELAQQCLHALEERISSL